MRHLIFSLFLLISLVLVGCTTQPVVPEQPAEDAVQEATSEAPVEVNQAAEANQVVEPKSTEINADTQQQAVAQDQQATPAEAEITEQTQQKPSPQSEAIVVAKPKQKAQAISTITVIENELPEQTQAETPATVVVSNKQAEAKKLLTMPQADMAPSDPIAVWLASADVALSRDRLTTPADNNAYALYSRVLLKEPKNNQALLGLEAIVQRYLVLAKSSHKKGNSNQAQLFLQRANKVVPGHQDIDKMRQQLKQMAIKAPAKSSVKAIVKSTKKPEYKALQTLAESVMTAASGMQRQRLLIPNNALQDKAPVLVNYLQTLAQQIESVDGRLYIIAPSDKQVRWIYSVLNATNPDYRIRANIKHQSPAAIEVIYTGDKPLLDVFHL
ncbi:MAG: hypothetical protein ACPH27_03810 [Pseudomonadales bacterium]